MLNTDLNTLATLGEILTPIFTLLGFVFVFLQIRGSTRATQAQAKAQIYGLGLRLHENTLTYPELRKFIYESAPVPEAGELRARVLVACEMYCDFFEYVLAEGDIIGEHVRQAWINMMRTLVRQSPAIRAFITENRNQYTSEFLAIFDAEARNRKASSVRAFFSRSRDHEAA